MKGGFDDDDDDDDDNLENDLRLKRELSKKANFTIRPDTLGIHWSNFEKFDEFISSITDVAKSLNN